MGRYWLTALVAIAAACFLIAAAWETCGFQGCPDPAQLAAFQPGGGAVLLDRHGGELAELHPIEARTVALDSLPEHVPVAFIAVEDRRFYRHEGIDFRRVVSAALRNVAAGGVREGASTITMQLARTLFPEWIPREDRSIRRKLLEMRMADGLERTFTKGEILELYLNHVYAGAGNRGVEAASRHYFDRSATELTVEEAALLAAILRAPGRYDPRTHQDRALQRRNLVLHLMEAQGLLDPAEAEAARERELAVSDQPPPRAIAETGPYFVEAVRRFLEESFEEGLYQAGMVVRTTLDPELQAITEEELVEQLESIEAGAHGSYEAPQGEDEAEPVPLQGAALVMDARTGAVLAMVGGRDFHASSFNRALRARRQVGSAFKPFVYAAALQSGFVASQPLADRPLLVSQPGSADWSPRNYDGSFRGPVSMREAIVHSLNVPTARVALAVGMPEVGRLAQDAGIEMTVPTNPAVALGTIALTPLELTTAYATFARGGGRAPAHLVQEVRDRDGEVLYQADFEVQNGIDPRLAYLVTDLLGDVVQRGTGYRVREAGYTGPAAGKTGTTQDAHDTWFVGYTPALVGTVWIGFDRPRSIVSGATGGRLAAPVWGRIMARSGEEAVGDGGEDVPWSRPEGVVERLVDPATGAVVGRDCPSPREGPVREVFLEEYAPHATCPEEDGWLDRITRFLSPGTGTSEERELARRDEDLEMDHVTPGLPAERYLGSPRVPLASSTGQPPPSQP